VPKCSENSGRSKSQFVATAAAVAPFRPGYNRSSEYRPALPPHRCLGPASALAHPRGPTEAAGEDAFLDARLQPVAGLPTMPAESMAPFGERLTRPGGLPEIRVKIGQKSVGLGFTTYRHGQFRVLVLHDWFCDHSSWDATLSYLTPNRFTYVFADLRGYGLSREIEETISG
jgi:hypothetical protein